MEKVCKPSHIAKATMKSFTIKDKQILVANSDGTFLQLTPHVHT